MLNQLKIFKLLIILFAISVIAIWSSQLITQWDVDYGVFYFGSYLLDDNFQLYNDFFTHKGPLYYLFLKSIGYLIGWGKWQAYFLLILTMLVFYVPIFFILLFERTSLQKFILGILLSLCLLYGQNTNSCVSFFQSGFLLMAFWLLLKKDNKYVLNFSFFLLVCAILARIDAIIYSPVYLFVLIYSNYLNNIWDYFKILFIWSLIIILTFLTLMFIFDFNISQYYIHNIKFNYWYKDGIIADKSLIYKLSKYIVRPSSYEIFTGSLLIFPFFMIFSQITPSFREFNLFIKNTFSNLQINNSLASKLLVSIILILGLFGWFLTMSDKNYHFIIVLFPVLMIILLNLNFFNFKQSILLISISLYCIITIIYSPIYKLYKNSECLHSVYCDLSNISEYSDTLKIMNNITDDEISIIGNTPWLYFFSNKKPKGSLNNYWFYFIEKPFETKVHLEEHKDLLKMPTGKIFFIDNQYLDIKIKNKFLKEILANSFLLKRQNKFSIYQVE